MIRRTLSARPVVREDLEAIDIHALADLAGTFAASYDTLRHATESTAPITDDNPAIEYDTLAPIYNTKMPAEMFDLSDMRKWCPDCYEGDELREEFRSVEPLQKALSIYFASDYFLQSSTAHGHPPFPSKLEELLWAAPCVTATLRSNDYLSRVFGAALLGVPEQPCGELLQR